MASNPRSRLIVSTPSTTSDDEQDYDQLDDLDEQERRAHDLDDTASVSSLTVSSLQSLSPPGSDEVMVEHEYSEESEFESGQEMMSGDEVGGDEDEDDHPMDQTLYARLPSLSSSASAMALGGRARALADPLIPQLDIQSFGSALESENTLGLVFPEPAILSELRFDALPPPRAPPSELSAVSEDAGDERATMTTSAASVTPSMFSAAHYLSDLGSLPPPSPEALHILFVGHKASDQLKHEVLDAVFNLWPAAVSPRGSHSDSEGQSRLLQFFDFRVPQPIEGSRSVNTVRLYDLSLRHVQSYYSVTGAMVNLAVPVPVLTVFLIDPSLCKGQPPPFFPSPMIGKSIAVVLPRGGHSVGSTPGTPNLGQQSVRPTEPEYVEVGSGMEPADLMSAQHIWSGLRSAWKSYLFEGLDMRQSKDFERQVITIGELWAASGRADVRLAASQFVSPVLVASCESGTKQPPQAELEDSKELSQSNVSAQTALAESVSTARGQEKEPVKEDPPTTSLAPVSEEGALEQPRRPVLGLLFDYATSLVTRYARCVPQWVVLRGLSWTDTWPARSMGLISLGTVAMIALALTTVTFQTENDPAVALAIDPQCAYPSWARVFCLKPVRPREQNMQPFPTPTSLLSVVETTVAETAMIAIHKVQATEPATTSRMLTLDGRKNTLSLTAPPTSLGIGGRIVGRTDGERPEAKSLSLLPVALTADVGPEKCLTCFQLFGPPKDVEETIVVGGMKSSVCADAPGAVQMHELTKDDQHSRSEVEIDSDEGRPPPVSSLSLVHDVSSSLVTAVKNHHKRAAHNVHVLNSVGCEMTKIAAHKLASVFQRGMSGLETEDEESWYDELMQPLRRALADRRDMKGTIIEEETDEEDELAVARPFLTREILRGVFAAAL